MNLSQLERRLAKLETERSATGGPVCLFQTVDEETGARTPSDAEIALQESEAERTGRTVILFRDIYEARPFTFVSS